MAYDPNWDSRGGGNNNSPGLGQAEDALRKRANGPPSTNGDPLNNPETAGGVADALDTVQGVFYGNQSAPGLLGGTRQVNPNAYWDISGDPYRVQGQLAGMRGPSFSGQEQDQSRLQQQSLIQMLQNQAAGTGGPSAAQNMLKQGTERNINSAMAMGASQRGPGAAGGAYQAQNQAVQANQQGAADAAQLRMQEQLQAQGLLGSVLGQTRGQDQGMMGLSLQDQKMKDDLVMQFTKMGFDADQANRQAAMKMEELKNSAYSGGDSGGGGIGGMISSFSDENLKTDVKDADGELSAFLDALEPHSYKYKDEKHGKGRRVSVMAQELEKSKLGEEFVFETPEGKAVDYGKGFGTMLAAQAALHKRLKKLEGK